MLSVSPAHDHQWTDTPGMGASIVVVTDKHRTDALDDPNHGPALAEKLGRDLYAIRDEVAQKFVELADGLDQAIAAPAAMWPIIVIDVPDNPGAGAPGDATQVLAALLERNTAGNPIQAAVMLWDPVVTKVSTGQFQTCYIPIGPAGTASPWCGYQACMHPGEGFASIAWR